jgi:hypothetical protein
MPQLFTCFKNFCLYKSFPLSDDSSFTTALSSSTIHHHLHVWAYQVLSQTYAFFAFTNKTTTAIFFLLLPVLRNVKLSMCLINWALCHKDIWGKWKYSSIILHFGTRWRWVVGFRHLPRYPRRNRNQYALSRRLGGYEEEKNLTLVGNRTQSSIP